MRNDVVSEADLIRETAVEVRANEPRAEGSGKAFTVQTGVYRANGSLPGFSAVVRRATLSDVEDMHRLINYFAGQGLMLPKSRSQLYQNIRDFFVALVANAAEKAFSGKSCVQTSLPPPRSETEKPFPSKKENLFAGCGALHVLSPLPGAVDLGEIRSLAVDARFHGNGVGRLIVQELLRDARVLGLPRVFVLTYQKEFFERLGFVEVDKATMPQKVWGECIDCPKFPNCDEIAMILDLEAST